MQRQTKRAEIIDCTEKYGHLHSHACTGGRKHTKWPPNEKKIMKINSVQISLEVQSSGANKIQLQTVCLHFSVRSPYACRYSMPDEIYSGISTRSLMSAHTEGNDA